MSKHTPGPWFAVDYAGFVSIQSVDEYSDSDVLNIAVDPNAEANGKLAAAAPDLLEALKEAQQHFVRSGWRLSGRTGKIMEAAIKKATE